MPSPKTPRRYRDVTMRTSCAQGIRGLRSECEDSIESKPYTDSDAVYLSNKQNTS